MTQKSLKFHFSLLLSLMCITAFAQISGNVTDENGEPIIGVNIIIAGTTQGTITDYDGNYSLPMAHNGESLIFSFLGYQTKTVQVGESSVVNVVLAEDQKALEEVLVIGYGQVRKGDATGALVSIKTDEEAKGVTNNAQDLLVGKVSGVTVLNDGGSPTGGSTIRIRGGSSLTASNDPLIVIDGVPIDNNGIGGVGNQLSTINPSDIETFTVLKDASATAIYGSRASNGVILITTKKGSDDKVTVQYDGSVSVSTKTKNTSVLDADAYRSYLIEKFKDEDNFSEVMHKIGDANTNWQDEIFRTAVSTKHNVSVFGSAPHMPYRASVGYDLDNGILKTSGTQRVTANVSLAPELFTKHLKIDVNGKFAYIKSRFANYGAIGTAVMFDPTQHVYDEGSPYQGYFTWTDDSGKPVGTAPTNPVSMLESVNDQSQAYSFIGNASFDYKVHKFEDLSAHLNLGMDYSNSNGGNYQAPDAPGVYAYGGYDGKWTQKRMNLLLDAYLQYAHDFSRHNAHFDIMAGYSYQQYNKDSWHRNQRIKSFDTDGNPELISTGLDKNYNCLVSFFGRVNFNILERYYLTATVRGDGSSRFAAKNRWGVFPSVAFAWKMINEKFLKNSNAVSDMKLRLGWGITGQQDINQGDYPYIGLYQGATGDQANYYIAYEQNGNGAWVPVIRPLAYNPDLKWEQTMTYNVGFDYGFINNRIYGSIEAYYRVTTDLINASTKAVAGTNFNEYVVANIGSLDNVGVEFSLNGIAVQTKNWFWEIGANVSWNKNTIRQLTYGDNSNSYRREGIKIQKVGCAANSYYVYEQIYDKDGKPIEGAYVDQNKDGVLNDDDLIVFHKAAPDVTLGLNTKLTYKAWDFSFGGHGGFGGYNYNSALANNTNTSNSSIYQGTYLLNRLTDVVALGYTSNQATSSYFIQEASFFRMDYITLGWSFNAKQSKFGGRVYATVQNPFVITKYKGSDPEINGGIDSDFYPRPLTVMLGINLKF
ncbi:MAG: SusC/RagA family TonB-linked outer membrane protein [Paludibacteraceae bacterium]|nr:SusC/RagA family TonB-linked outer membrane protein [Paludibacteraceae bacterium]